MGPSRDSFPAVPRVLDKPSLWGWWGSQEVGRGCGLAPGLRRGGQLGVRKGSTPRPWAPSRTQAGLEPGMLHQETEASVRASIRHTGQKRMHVAL